MRNWNFIYNINSDHDIDVDEIDIMNWADSIANEHDLDPEIDDPRIVVMVGGNNRLVAYVDDWARRRHYYPRGI
jgi:hypothetical protein